MNDGEPFARELNATRLQMHQGSSTMQHPKNTTEESNVQTNDVRDLVNEALECDVFKRMQFLFSKKSGFGYIIKITRDKPCNMPPAVTQISTSNP